MPETPTLVAIAPGVGLFRSYERAHLRNDLPAALALWALLIPQGLAYAQLAGMPPVTGLYTGLMASVAYGLFGTSRYLSMGPESSTAILVAGSIVPLARGDPGRTVALAGMLALLTAGVLLVGFVLRLGVLTRLLSSPILTGYLAGSAVVMAVTQLPKAFGFPVDPERYPLIVGGIVVGIADTNLWALGIAIGTIAVMVLLQRYLPRLPAGFIALVVATVVVVVAGLADQVSVIGDIARGLPRPMFPGVRLRDVVSLLVPAASVALLVFSGSVLTAQALAARDGEDVDANHEFVGLAAGNLVVGFFGGFPAAGSESRSFTVATSGATSQMAGFVAAALVLLTLAVLTPVFHDVPNAALGGVVLVTASKLFDTKAMRTLWRVRRADFLLMAVTFGGVLLTGVLGGIVIGVIASLAEMVRRTIQPRTAVLGMAQGTAAWQGIREHPGAQTIPGLIVYRFDAPLFFGNADVFRKEVRELVRTAPDPVRAVVVTMEAVTDLDTTGTAALDRLLSDLAALDVRLVLARVRTHVLTMLQRTGLEEKIGPEHIHPTVRLAVASLDLTGAAEPVDPPTPREP